MAAAQIINLIAEALASKVKMEVDIHIRIGGQPEKEEKDGTK